jgi:hypothetical protein
VSKVRTDTFPFPFPVSRFSILVSPFLHRFEPFPQIGCTGCV